MRHPMFVCRNSRLFASSSTLVNSRFKLLVVAIISVATILSMSSLNCARREWIICFQRALPLCRALDCDRCCRKYVQYSKLNELHSYNKNCWPWPQPAQRYDANVILITQTKQLKPHIEVNVTFSVMTLNTVIQSDKKEPAYYFLLNAYHQIQNKRDEL